MEEIARCLFAFTKLRRGRGIKPRHSHDRFGAVVITNPRRDFTARGFTESYALYFPSDITSQPISLASCDISEVLVEIQALARNFEAPAPARVCDNKIGGFVLCASALVLYVHVFITTGSERSADMMVVSFRCEDALVRYYNKFGFTFVQKEPDWGFDVKRND